jgi:nitrogen fixation protein FixH
VTALIRAALHLERKAKDERDIATTLRRRGDGNAAARHELKAEAYEAEAKCARSMMETARMLGGAA